MARTSTDEVLEQHEDKAGDDGDDDDGDDETGVCGRSGVGGGGSDGEETEETCFGAASVILNADPVTHAETRPRASDMVISARSETGTTRVRFVVG